MCHEIYTTHKNTSSDAETWKLRESDFNTLALMNVQGKWALVLQLKISINFNSPQSKLSWDPNQQTERPWWYNPLKLTAIENMTTTNNIHVFYSVMITRSACISSWKCIAPYIGLTIFDIILSPNVFIMSLSNSAQRCYWDHWYGYHIQLN